MSFVTHGWPLVAIFSICPTVGTAQSYAKEPASATFTRCVADSAFALGSIRVSEPARAVKDLGKPLSLRHDRIDNGEVAYARTVYTFRQLRVAVADGVIDEIQALSPAARAANGVHLGMRRDSVQMRLGDLRESARARLAFGRSCNDEFEVVVGFNARGEVIKLTMSRDRS